MSTIVTKINPTTYELKSETRSVMLTAEEVKAINDCRVKDELRSAITYVVDHMIEDEDIDITDYPYTYEELIDELYIDYLDDILLDDNPMPSDDDIYDTVIDLIDFYIRINKD